MKAFFGGVFMLVALGMVFFLAPWLVTMGWGAARELWPELPAMTYWQAFWITHAIGALFGHGRISELKKPNEDKTE